MWLLFAVGSAFFAGVTSILAKCGIRRTDSTVATAVRTVVILVFSWIMVFFAGSWDQLSSVKGSTLVFLILSGAATGASWLCYFKALQLGDINKVVPLDQIQYGPYYPLGIDLSGGGHLLGKGWGSPGHRPGDFSDDREKGQSGRREKGRYGLVFLRGRFCGLCQSYGDSWEDRDLRYLSPIWEQPSVPVLSWSWHGLW